MMKYQKHNGGYIALMTTVILGLVLLTLLVVASNIGFSGRFNVLDAEAKTISAQTAHACKEIVLLKMKQNPTYEGAEVVSVGENVCWVPRVTGVNVFHVQSVFNNAYTNLEISVIDETQIECAYFDVTDGSCILP